MRNENGMLRLSGEEMLALWKRRIGLECAMRDCVIEREDGVDVDRRLAEEIESWYLDLLLTAPAHLLPVEDVGNEVTMVIDGEGVAICALPAQVVRPVSWQLDCWHAPVERFYKAGDAMAERQRNRWLRGGTECPVCVDCGGEMRLYSASSAQSTLSRALCVVRPTSGEYVLHGSLLYGIDDT